MSYDIESELTKLSDDLYNQTLGSPVIQTPFGKKYAIYADTMASGIIFKPIEHKMELITKYYANTHSNAHHGKLMSSLISQSKQLIRKSLNANLKDQVIFTANGASGAIKHLIHLLHLDHPCGVKGAPRKTKPTIFVTEMEHHSNYLPWKHLPVELVIISMTTNGCPDLKMMEQRMKQCAKNGCDIYASVTAGSNVTGVICPRHKMAKLVHKYGGKIFLDCAAIAPYEPLNMHTDDNNGDYFDALYISPHKLIGGPGSPGLLIANETLFINAVPFMPSGGTVRFVCREFQVYSESMETKESGGTPNILGCIRSGLVFELKDDLQPYIKSRDKEILKYVDTRLRKIKNVKVLNPNNPDRIPVFSFMINGLHYNFVVVLLNDLFGIQSRGGVSCCSLLAQKLLGFKPCDKKRVHKSIVNDKGVPDDYGWVRVSFHYSMPQRFVEYIVKSIDFISKFGKHLLLKYTYLPEKNNWVYNDWIVPSDMIKLTWKSVPYDLNGDKLLLPSTKYLTNSDLQNQFTIALN